MQVGDLVFVHGRPVGKYQLTKPGSWGYVLLMDWGGPYIKVDFKHYGVGTKKAFAKDTMRRYDIRIEDLRVLPNPPKSKKEITKLVRLLTKLTA